MEAPIHVNAEEELRRKLLKYLAAKGKLKPQNNQKPYLKDTTNVQNRCLPPPKKVYENKDVYNKGAKCDVKNTRLPQRSVAGKIPAHPNVPYNKADTKAFSKIHASYSLPSARPEQTVQDKDVGSMKQLAGRKSSSTMPQITGSEAESGNVGLTILLTKSQEVNKTRVSGVHVLDNSFLSSEGQSEAKDVKSHDGKSLANEGQKLLQPSSKMPVRKSQAHTPIPKSMCHKSDCPPPSCIPVPTKSAGHIRIVSRVTQPGLKVGSATERSFLIKSARTNTSQPKPQPTVQKKIENSTTQKLDCTAKLNSDVRSASSSAVAQKKVDSSGRCSTTQKDNKPLGVQNRRSVTKPAVWQTNTGPVLCNKGPGKRQIGSSNQRKSKGGGQEGVTDTNESQPATFSSVASEIASKPQTPKMTGEDRRKQLAEWQLSKGKTYKRPPMVLPPKRPPTAKKKQNLNASVWEGIEAEEELLFLSMKINQTLSECLALVDKCVSAEDIHSALDKIPEGKKFAKYWVCKAKLLEREGIFDVVEIYKQGVQCGATPIDELREVVFDIMKNTNKKTKVVTFGPLPSEDTAVDREEELAENKAENSAVENEEAEDKAVQCHVTPVTKPADDAETACSVTGHYDQGSAVKFQVACPSSKKKRDGSSQEWKCLTPVRRSLRIHQSASLYPETVQEHDTVVASLDELLDMADTETYLYVRNEALPEEADHTILSMVKEDGGSEGQKEEPV
ncbi:cytoskeleton-associated protein 2-like [Hyperolius riggenbachi]|uniref:cytoskeleton-associated protein 2-like n=1 Tax=Hyperolius riggenbachi TaxID=752182 RepID=UPI0035A3030F